MSSLSFNLMAFSAGFVGWIVGNYVYDKIIVNTKSDKEIPRFSVLGRNAYEIQDFDNLEKHLFAFEALDNESKRAHELFRKLKANTPEYSNVTWDIRTRSVTEVTGHKFSRSSTRIVDIMNLVGIKEVGGKIILHSSDEQNLGLVIAAVKNKVPNFEMSYVFYST